MNDTRFCRTFADKYQRSTLVSRMIDSFIGLLLKSRKSTKMQGKLYNDMVKLGEHAMGKLEKLSRIYIEQTNDQKRIEAIKKCIEEAEVMIIRRNLTTHKIAKLHNMLCDGKWHVRKIEELVKICEGKMAALNATAGDILQSVNRLACENLESRPRCCIAIFNPTKVSTDDENTLSKDNIFNRMCNMKSSVTDQTSKAYVEIKKTIQERFEEGASKEEALGETEKVRKRTNQKVITLKDIAQEERRTHMKANVDREVLVETITQYEISVNKFGVETFNAYFELLVRFVDSKVI